MLTRNLQMYTGSYKGGQENISVRYISRYTFPEPQTILERS